MKNNKIAILGADGFLGKQLNRFFMKYCSTYGITRTNYSKYIGKSFDFFINANGNSRRYWANNNTYNDFQASTVSVYKTMEDFTIGCYVYLSSIDVYENHENSERAIENGYINPIKLCPYGFNKFISEMIVKKYASKYIILRSSAMIGPDIKKGPIKDILEDAPLYITLDSKLQFISISAIADIILELIKNNNLNETFNVGGIGTLQFKDLETILQRKIKINHDAEKQVYEMNVDKLRNIYKLKSSEDYVKEYLESVKKTRQS
jgi:nucleoside-diphosphate-sugar epimerase